MERTPLLCASLALGACQATETWPPPPLEGAKSLVMLVERNNEPERAYVVDADEPLPGLVVDEQRSEIRVYVWIFEETSSTLGFVEGELELGGIARAAPRPARAFELDAPYADWVPTVANEQFARLPIPRLDAFCDPFEGYERVEQEVRRSTALGPFFTENARLGSLLVGNGAGVWEVGPDFALPKIGPAASSTAGPSNLATHPLVGAHWNRLPPGEHLYYQADGNLWTSVLERPLVWVSRNPGAHDSTNAWVAGSDDKSPFEIFILDDHGNVWRYDDVEWTAVRTPTEPEDLGDAGALVWIGPNDLMMLGANGRVLRIQDGSTEDITPEGMARPTVLINEYHVGLFLGDNAGQLWRNDGGAWSQLTGPGDGPVLAISPHNGGYLYGGHGGAMHYFRDGEPSCDTTIYATGTVFRATRLYDGETLLVSTSATMSEPGALYATAFIPTVP